MNTGVAAHDAEVAEEQRSVCAMRDSSRKMVRIDRAVGAPHLHQLLGGEDDDLAPVAAS